MYKSTGFVAEQSREAPSRDGVEQTALANNNGVDSMRDGDLGRALHFFRAALQGALTGCAGATSMHMEDDSVNHGDTASSGGLPVHITPLKRHLVPYLLPWVSSDEYLHAQGMYILPGEASYTTSDDLIDSAILSSIVLYNIALVFHAKALEEGGADSDAANRQGRLRKAQSLYMRSLCVLDESGMFPTNIVSSSNPSIRGRSPLLVIEYLSMAVLNNLGYVSYQLADYDECSSTFDQLVKLIVSLPATTVETATVNSSQEMENFPSTVSDSSIGSSSVPALTSSTASDTSRSSETTATGSNEVNSHDAVSFGHPMAGTVVNTENGEEMEEEFDSQMLDFDIQEYEEGAALIEWYKSCFLLNSLSLRPPSLAPAA